jgi:cytochrome c-type biogenesis protein CcmF
MCSACSPGSRGVLSVHPGHLEPVPAHLTPFEGRDLNPILQDPGLAIHPPMLYLGYVGFSISFSFASALIEGRIDAAWARWVRPWTLLAWMCLTAGIALGSFWAYYTRLGAGGSGTRSNASRCRGLPARAAPFRGRWRSAMPSSVTILLAILAFSLHDRDLPVRSGVLTSVHAFASDPTRGVHPMI